MSSATRRWPRALGWFAAGAATTMLLWVGGLAWFVHSSLSITADPTTETDAIVVLTGGRLRLEAGLDLLGAGRARKLFVSGVNPHVDRLELMRVAGYEGSDLSRIVIGHDADNTLGNARETAGWMRQEGYRSLRLVTSWYQYSAQPARIRARDAQHGHHRPAGLPRPRRGRRPLASTLHC